MTNSLKNENTEKKILLQINSHRNVNEKKKKSHRNVNILRFLSSFFPQPITVHIVPRFIFFKVGGGRQIGSKCSWNATRVAN